MSITPKNWGDFQHYKDRAPAWIKLHRGLLDNFEFHCLPLASKALAPMLWLLASEYEGGQITAGIEEMAFRFRMTPTELGDALSPLIQKGFFISSETLEACKQDASTTLAECLPREREEIEEEIEGGASAPEKVVSLREYVFEGGIIRLERRAYDTWRKAYPNIEDFDAELQAADDYYVANPPKDRKWFFAVSNWLKKANTTALERKRKRIPKI